jgi:hypothetical protein
MTASRPTASGIINLHGSLYERRDMGELWFPKTEFNIKYRHIFNADHEHSWDGIGLPDNAFDNRVIDINVKQLIYDFSRPDSDWRVSPGINFGGGREFGIESNYLKFGPVVDFAYKSREILSVSVLNYKHHFSTEGHQIHPIAVTLDIGKTYKAVKASRIKQVNDPSLETSFSPDTAIEVSFSEEAQPPVIHQVQAHKPADLKLRGLVERDLGAN